MLRHLYSVLLVALQKAALSGDKIAISSNLEPRSGFEPETPSFAYTSLLNMLYERARLYLEHIALAT